jgi:hypothetical protein
LCREAFLNDFSNLGVPLSEVVKFSTPQMAPERTEFRYARKD